ncbi:pyrroloquinoline quinone-dependent dehydrogenase [Aeoliella sp. ICT_H6.2]|uniref:Pyrroloquinoline quinone-dependent dehydrogenase n=1 Tax=Aeoliella straminimaris TaxID=2954799 RepID=A0A9X2FGJ7_9BACT|nr:pyrroloquinoline quinone-dependent dehydrogenase [Aeoliella straminimaris]MCO6048003.1 pyrroloquinoline quinone-dependent dehydrogenase [Aeoliella straminimaris]
MFKAGTISQAICAFLVAVAIGGQGRADAPAGPDWPYVGGNAGGMRYSTLDEIHRENVGRLEPAWTFATGELNADGTGPTIECTPIVVEGVMYITTGNRVVVALDAATGEEIWRFDPHSLPYPHGLASGGVNRGCAYWSDGKAGGERRILHGTSDGRLFSLDAATGKLDPKFGARGVRDMRLELTPAEAKLSYGPTSAPAVWKNLVIVGYSCGEGPDVSAPGDIRAFDVRTGDEVWRFHTVPQPGEFGHDTWEGDSWKHRGGANAWPGLTVDIERGMVFAGTGSAAFDFFGGDRAGENLFANCTLALDAATGKRVWHFQSVHHDLLDHDLPTPPNLVTVEHDGKAIDAAVQVTKTGYVYLFDRQTGEPLFDVVETPAPASTIAAEKPWPTQPIPVRPPPLVAQHFDETNVTNIGEANRQDVLRQLEGLRYGPAFNPPSLDGTVAVPGFHGGANWSGASFDPTSGLLYVNVTNCPNIVTLLDDGPPSSKKYGTYRQLGYIQFRDHEGYPAIAPPWGELVAVDLNRGDIAWRTTLGEFHELTERGIPPTGTESFGGTIVTAGGLVLIAGTKDEKFRALDKSTGEVLWQHKLPAGGYATPATYAVNGKQFVVIAAGGAGKQRTKAGDKFIAFALPDTTKSGE